MLEEKGKVKDIFHRLGKGFGIEQIVDGANLGTFRLDKGSLAFAFECIVDDSNVFFDGRECFTRFFLILDIFWLDFLGIIVFFFNTSATHRLSAFLGSIVGIERTRKERDTRGDGIEANTDLRTEQSPIKASSSSTKLLTQLVGQLDGIITGDLCN